MWFQKLALGSVTSFSYLSMGLLQNDSFQMLISKSIDILLEVVKKLKDSFTHYVERFEVALLKVQHLDWKLALPAFTKGMLTTVKLLSHQSIIDNFVVYYIEG